MQLFETKPTRLVFAPRPYQVAAVDAVCEALKDPDERPLVELPTGAGKTKTMAEIIMRQPDSARIVVLSHVGELVQQTADELESNGVEASVLSAGLGRREVGRVTVGTIQTVSTPANLARLGKVDLVLVDEAHHVPPEGTGLYRRLLAALPGARLIGLTATPYRSTTGRIDGKDQPFTRIVCKVPVRDLQEAGYLSALRYKLPPGEIDTAQVKVKRGEFEQGKLNEEALKALPDTVKNLIERAADRSSCLVFASSVEHSTQLAAILDGVGGRAVSVDGTTPWPVREQAVRDFKAGKIRWLCNFGCYTEGFDAPNVSCIGLLRPTMSPGLYYQMVGRGLRKADGKPDCLVLDFGGNVSRHGPIDALKDVGVKDGCKVVGGVKKCPVCFEIIPPKAVACPGCGEPVQRGERGEVRLEDEAYDGIEQEPVWYDVRRVQLKDHMSKAGNRTLAIQYSVDDPEFRYPVTMWLPVESHNPWARRQAEIRWSMARGPGKLPRKVSEAAECTVVTPKRIAVIQENGWPRVVGIEFGGQDDSQIV